MDSGKNSMVEEALKELFKLKNDVETELRLIKIDAFSGEFVDFPERLAPEIAAIYKKRGLGTYIAGKKRGGGHADRFGQNADLQRRRP
jgi:hypothetical protein